MCSTLTLGHAIAPTGSVHQACLHEGHTVSQRRGAVQIAWHQMAHQVLPASCWCEGSLSSNSWQHYAISHSKRAPHDPPLPFAPKVTTAACCCPAAQSRLAGKDGNPPCWGKGGGCKLRDSPEKAADSQSASMTECICIASAPIWSFTTSSFFAFSSLLQAVCIRLANCGMICYHVRSTKVTVAPVGTTVVVEFRDTCCGQVSVGSQQGSNQVTARLQQVT